VDSQRATSSLLRSDFAQSTAGRTPNGELTNKHHPSDGGTPSRHRAIGRHDRWSTLGKVPVIHFNAAGEPLGWADRQSRHDYLAVLRACPINFVDGMLPAGAPDARTIAVCYGHMLITLADHNQPRGWVLTEKGRQHLGRERG
jgi:hypothetical protein